MIKKLRIKFILLAGVSLFALLFLLVAGMNLLNYRAVVREADTELAILSGTQGKFPDFGGGPAGPQGHREPREDARYFSVILNEENEVVRVETDRFTALDRETAAAYAAAAKGEKGFTKGFRYLRDGRRITFLDCGRSLDNFYTFLLISGSLALAGFILVLLIIAFFSGRIIRPIGESYEKQKRFITDAGHEMKTPLTIINANVDVLEMDFGKNESLADIQQQTKRLAALTNNLVYLARMEEEHPLPMIEFPLSEIVQEAAAPFGTLAEAQKKRLHCRIQPLLSLKGNENAIGQLVSILLDNAIKYSPAESEITLTLTRQGRNILLKAENPTEAPIPPADLRRVFDRFYRTDPSRNSETGGHGIGLSIAKAIVSAHGGKIYAQSEGNTFIITAALPT